MKLAPSRDGVRLAALDRGRIRVIDLSGTSPEVSMVAEDAFDLVLFNPPFYRGLPRDTLDQAWRSPDVFERFAAGLDGVLAPNGCVLLALSTDGDCAELLAELRTAGFSVGIAEQTDLINEVVTIYAVRRPN